MTSCAITGVPAIDDHIASSPTDDTLLRIALAV
jgi:hypothetical protein